MTLQRRQLHDGTVGPPMIFTLAKSLPQAHRHRFQFGVVGEGGGGEDAVAVHPHHAGADDELGVRISLE